MQEENKANKVFKEEGKCHKYILIQIQIEDFKKEKIKKKKKKVPKKKGSNADEIGEEVRGNAGGGGKHSAAKLESAKKRPADTALTQGNANKMYIYIYIHIYTYIYIYI